MNRQAGETRARAASRRKKLLSALLLCAAGIGINYLFSYLAIRLNLPMYLDCIGIIVSAAVGGYIPGIVVGFFTNIIKGVFDSSSVYYSFTSVLIAICASAYARRGYYRRFPHILLPILAFSAIGGGIGSVLTWLLFGGGIGDGFTAPLARQILSGGVVGEFLSQLTADFVWDLLDKTVEVLAAALILRLIPASFYKRFEFSREDYHFISRDQSHVAKYVSLRFKVLALVSAAAVIITAGVTAISLSLYHRAILETEGKMATGVAHTAASAFDSERVEEYMTLGEAAEGYREVEAHLAHIAESSEDIAYVYVYRILPDGCHVVFDPDTSAGEGSDPGTVIPFDDAFQAVLPTLLAGGEIDPIVSNETYGWLLTVYLPVYDAAGQCQCYVGVDILMSRLTANEISFVTKVLSLFLAFSIMLLALGAWAADRSIIHPINQMARATGEFAYNSEAVREDSLERIQELHIATGDEIENLYHAIQSTTEETVQYIAVSQEKSEQIAHLQSSLILVLADLVESRDKCTGNHVRNTATYVHMIMEKMREMGLHTQELTDEYMEDVYNSAPLHDVGKIQISDTLLNKPGRLTEEEFHRMQLHTTLGADIIDRAIDMMPTESAGYLTEARNLTLYHHERWDGTGYPRGLKGEEIPLSARLMAVADVFDALVSRRSYKNGFPFEKAIDIIRQESGTHFDPDVVNAFLQCQDEARRVAEAANEKSKSEY